MPGPAVPPVNTGSPASPINRYAHMVISTCRGVSKNPKRFTNTVCSDIGDSENGSGIITYADTQFIAIKSAIFTISRTPSGLFVPFIVLTLLYTYRKQLAPAAVTVKRCAVFVYVNLFSRKSRHFKFNVPVQRQRLI